MPTAGTGRPGRQDDDRTGVKTFVQILGISVHFDQYEPGQERRKGFMKHRATDVLRLVRA
jgi:hypothetical protein